MFLRSGETKDISEATVKVKYIKDSAINSNEINQMPSTLADPFK